MNALTDCSRIRLPSLRFVLGFHADLETGIFSAGSKGLEISPLCPRANALMREMHNLKARVHICG